MDVSNSEVALLFIEREKAMIPVNPMAFSVSQQSVGRLNSTYSGALVVYRNGVVQAIDRIEQLGVYGDSMLKKLQSLFVGTHSIQVRFRKEPLSLEQVKHLIASCLPADAERGDPYLPLTQPVNVVMKAVWAATSFEEIFNVLPLPNWEDCLDGL